MISIDINTNPDDGKDNPFSKESGLGEGFETLDEMKQRLLDEAVKLVEGSNQQKIDKITNEIEKIELKQRQFDDLTSFISDYSPIESVIPNLSNDEKQKLTKTSPQSSSSSTSVFEQRIENLSRTIESKEFKNYETQLRPFFDSLRDKSAKQTSIDDVNSLVENEVTKQLSNITDVETSLYNSIDLMIANVNEKFDKLSARAEKEKASVESFPEFEKLNEYQERLDGLRENVGAYIEGSVQKIKDSAVASATAGYDEGQTERLMKDAEKEQKRVEKLVSSFNKDFQKYIDKQKEDIAKQYAFNTATNYLRSNKDATRQVASKVYKNAYNDFMQNVQTPDHGLTDEEISTLFAATGGNLDPSKHGKNKVTPPPKFRDPNNLPPTTLDGYSKDPPDNNISSLDTGNGSGGGTGRIGVHMIMSEVRQAIIDPITNLLAIPTDLASAHLQHLSWATTKERIQVPQLVRSMGQTTQHNTESVLGAAGATIGGTMGAAAGGIGMLPGAYMGGAIGTAVGEAIPIETISNMVGYLYEIAENTSKQVEGYSPDLIQSNIDKQLAFLEENISIGQRMGSELAELNDATADLQLTFYREAIELMRPMLPNMILMVKLLTEIVKYINTIITILTTVVGTMFPALLSVVNKGISRFAKKQVRTFTNQMDQLEDNVPFL